MIYSDVVNHNVLNNPNCNVYNNGIHNNGINHPMHHQRPLQQQQPQHMIQQPPNSMPPIKNGNSNLLIEQQKSTGFYPSPPNYYNNLSPQPTNLQQPSPIANSLNSNSMNNNSLNNSSINNACFADKKSPPISVNGNGLNSFFSGSADLANCNNLIKPSTVEKVPPDQAINISISSLASFNSISSPSSLTPSNHSITPKKSQTSELNSSLTVHNLESKTKQKAETKTVIIFKIVDQVVFNGHVVRETVVKNDEIVRHTGYINWPADGSKRGEEHGEAKSETKSGMFKQNDKSPAAKKIATPKASKNLKRSSVGQQVKEKKIKTETESSARTDSNKRTDTKAESNAKIESNARTDLPSKYKAEQPKKSPTVAEKEATTSTETTAASEDKKVALRAESGDSFAGKSIPEISITADTSSSAIKQQTASSPAPSNPAALYEIEDPIFKPIDLDQRVLAKWTDKSYYPGKVLAKENDSKWKIGFDDGGRRLIRENEIICIEFIPNGQKVMTMVNYQAHYCLKGVVKSRRIDDQGECFYMIEHYSNGKCYETEYISKDVFLNGEHALSLLSRRKQNTNDSKFAGVDLNNIIAKRSRASIKSSLNDSSNGPQLNERNSLTAGEIEMIDNDSNSNLSCSTNNSSATTSSASKKSGKKGKSIGKQPNASSNEEPSVSVGATKSAEAKVESAKSEIQVNQESKPEESSRLHDSFEDNLIGPIPNSTSELFKSFAFLLSFEDQKQSSDSDEVAGYSIPFDINHLTKQITNGAGLILDKYEDVKVGFFFS